jgi:hypothetical protein
VVQLISAPPSVCVFREGFNLTTVRV